MYSIQLLCGIYTAVVIGITGLVWAVLFKLRRRPVHPLVPALLGGLLQVGLAIPYGVAFAKAYARATGDHTANIGAGMLTFLCLVLAPFVGLGMFLLAYSIYPRRKRRKRQRYCRCGYDLTGNVSGICPECGSPVKKT